MQLYVYRILLLNSIHSFIYSAGGLEALPPNRLKTWTKLDPKTTKMKKAIRAGLTRGPSSSRSATLPGSTFPRLVMFLSNLLFRLRMFLGRGCGKNKKEKGLRELSSSLESIASPKSAFCVQLKSASYIDRQTNSSGLVLRTRMESVGVYQYHTLFRSFTTHHLDNFFLCKMCWGVWVF